MEKDNKRPNAALINREWYESASGVLEGRKLAHLVLYAIEYVLYGNKPEIEDNDIRLVFAMIKPALDSDVNKYLERCARNADNAKRGAQRVAASGTQSQRVGANTTTTPTTTTTTTTTTTSSISQDKAVEKEKWLIFGYFWSIGSKCIKEELNAFWSYYESLGWKNNKGAAIVSKLACARMWRRQFETGQAPNGAEVWFKALQSCNIPDYGAFLCFLGAERSEGNVIVRLRCKSSFYEDMKKAVPDFERTLLRCWGCQEVVPEFL